MTFNEKDWSIQEEIRRRVELEDMVRWAAAPRVETDEEVLRREMPTGRPLGHGFPLQVLKYLQP